MLTTCRLSIGGVALFYFYVLDNAYELSRYYNREQRIYDALKRYVAQGKQKHYKVAGKVHGLYFQPQEPRKAHCQCVVATGCAAGSHAQTCTYTDEKRADYRSYERHIRNSGKQRWEQLAYLICERKAAGCDYRIRNKASSQ